MIRYATIGTGWIAESFITGALRLSDMTLHAVYSCSAERGQVFANKMKAARRGGEIKVYTSLSDMAADPDIDAVYIASPNREHVPQSEQMLRAGKHVICEKPIAIDPEDLQRLQQLAEEKHLIYMEAIMMLHQPQLAPLKAELSKLGRIRTAHIDFSQYSSKYERYLKYMADPKNNELPNIFNPALQTGALEDLGIYCVYLILELFGKPEKLEAFPVFMESGADAAGEVIFFYNDAHVTMTYSKVGQNRLGSVILGDKGTITMESCSKLDNMARYTNAGEKVWEWGLEDKEDLMGREAVDFEAFITKPETREQYEACVRKAMDVCKIMKRIRDIQGIRFV